MRDVPADGTTPGEVIVRAPWLTQGYLKDDRNSEKLWQGGWLHTNDIAVRNETGYIRITDRRKDVIKIAGEWISSLELEEVLTHHPAVSEVAVIGAPDLKWGERPLALVVLRPDYREPVTEKDLVNYLRGCAAQGGVAKHAVVLKVRLVEAIDRTSVGKVNKVALRKKYLESSFPQ